LLQPESLTNAALDAVTVGRQGSVLSRDHDSEPCAAGCAPLDEEGITLEGTAPALAQQALELRFVLQPAGLIQPETLAGRGYNPRRLRPRARRLRNTARPPLVRLRTRKPWRRARRVLEG
jgi:hypothetical protein